MAEYYTWASPGNVGNLTVIQLREYLKPLTPIEEKQEAKDARALGFAEMIKEFEKRNLKPPTKEAEQILKDDKK